MNDQHGNHHPTTESIEEQIERLDLRKLPPRARYRQVVRGTKAAPEQNA